MDDALRSAFSGLFASTHRRVGAYVVRSGAAPSDADDIVAEVFVVAWRRVDDVPSDDPVPWLLGVARNVLRNHRRAAARADALHERLRALPRPEVLQPADDTDDVVAVREALADLSEADRELLQLAALEGLTPSQIARVLGGRPVTARVRLHRVRRRMRGLLEARSGTRPAQSVAAGTSCS